MGNYSNELTIQDSYIIKGTAPSAPCNILLELHTTHITQPEMFFLGETWNITW